MFKRRDTVYCAQYSRSRSLSSVPLASWCISETHHEVASCEAPPGQCRARRSLHVPCMRRGCAFMHHKLASDCVHPARRLSLLLPVLNSLLRNYCTVRCLLSTLLPSSPGTGQRQGRAGGGKRLFNHLRSFSTFSVDITVVALPVPVQCRHNLGLNDAFLCICTDALSLLDNPDTAPPASAGDQTSLQILRATSMVRSACTRKHHRHCKSASHSTEHLGEKNIKKNRQLANHSFQAGKIYHPGLSTTSKQPSHGFVADVVFRSCLPRDTPRDILAGQNWHPERRKVW
ncbi:hypothetical protein F5884DRAFT_161875 [Xylogone sp. PMI_703]|nr:hypothetical protein F5884DRAFT_161875 [Xylogone sp. PMI_703]